MVPSYYFMEVHFVLYYMYFVAGLHPSGAGREDIQEDSKVCGIKIFIFNFILLLVCAYTNYLKIQFSQNQLNSFTFIDL